MDSYLKRERRRAQSSERQLQLLLQGDSSFKRRIPLPQDADLGQIQANATDGVLKIVVPKSERAAPASRKIEIKTA